MQTRDEVEGLHNRREFSQRLECLYQAMQTQEKVFYRPIRLTQCCTQFKSPGDKILCVLHLHYNMAFTFK